jgi:hypothetical protein
LGLPLPEYSSPAAIELLNALYYIIPLTAFDIIFLLISKRKSKTANKSKTNSEEKK